MAVQNLAPFSSGRGRGIAARSQDDPFVEVRREMNRMFEDFFRGFGLPSLWGPARGQMPGMVLTPRVDVSETDDEIRIAAELPGIDESNIEVVLADDVLTIRGVKQAEREEEDRDYHLMERAQGTFSRSLLLPFSVDPDQVRATFKNGVLTVTIPKPQEEQEKVSKIEVTREEGAAAARKPQVERAAAGDKPAQDKPAQGGEQAGKTAQAKPAE